jgi:hypothetical protein
MCEDVAPNFGKNRSDCFTTTTPRFKLPPSPSSFWRNIKWLSSPTHGTPLIWHPVISSYFQKWNWSWKDAGLVPLRRSRPNRGECLTLWQNRTSRKRFNNGGDGGTGVYMQDGTTSRMMAADRPYGEFYNFTASVRNILDTTSYWILSLQNLFSDRQYKLHYVRFHQRMIFCSIHHQYLWLRHQLAVQSMYASCYNMNVMHYIHAHFTCRHNMPLNEGVLPHLPCLEHSRLG